MYGVYPGVPAPCNLKTNSKGSGLPMHEPVDIVFSRQDRTVKFLSKQFDFYQTDLPPDKDFCIAVTMGVEGTEVEIELLNIF